MNLIKLSDNNQSLWQVQGDTASFSLVAGDKPISGFEKDAAWVGELELRRPDLGLRVTCDSRSGNPDVSATNDTHLFALDFPSDGLGLSGRETQPLLQETFVRQGDLITSYPQRPNRPFSLQLDFKVLPIQTNVKSALTDAANVVEEGLLVELWISQQTYLLDTHPSVAMNVLLKPATAPPSRHAIAILSGQCPPSGLYVTYMVDPHDQIDTKWEHHDSLHVARFFGHFMEKGVIRRARLRCLVTKKPVCSDFIAEQYKQLVDSPLPLTA
jgi:hypothetical protein